MAENEIITPKENLKANTVADTRAIAAKRGAINAERQAMQTERTLQRKYRRAVRNDDFGGAADISKLLAQTGGSTVGPVIRQAEQERAVAGQRAIDRADQQNKIRAGGTAALMPGDQRPVEPDPANPPAAVNAGNQPGADEVAAQATANPEAKAGAGNGRATKGDATALKGSQRAAKDGSDGAIGDRNEAADSIEAQGPAAPEAQPKKADGSFRPNNRKNFIEDLRSSNLFKAGDPNAVERAIKRGEGLGINRDQVEAFARGGDASLSGIAKEKANQLASKRAQEALSDELIKDNRLERLKEGKDSMAKLKRAGELLDSFDGVSAPSRYGPDGDIAQSSFVRKDVEKSPILGPSFPLSKEAALEMDPNGKEGAAYWNVDPYSIAGKKTMNVVSSPYDGDRSDPRYPAMRIKAEAFDEVSGLDYSKTRFQVLPEIARKNAAQQIMIKKALDRNVDISGFTRQDVKFHESYLEAKKNRAEINLAIKDSSRLKSKVKSLLPS